MKWSSAKVKKVQQWLVESWPELFTPGPDSLPLSLDVHKEILKYREQNPELSRRTLDEALNRHTKSFGYLYGLCKHKQRFNLVGKAVQDVEVEQKEKARATLREMQRIAQKKRKMERLAMGNKRSNLVNGNQPLNGEMPVRAPVSSAARKTPVISYRQKRRKLVRPVAAETLSIAS